MSSKTRPRADDKGSIAIEVIVFGLLLPALIVYFALDLLGIQRDSFAAQHAARQAVRMMATSHWYLGAQSALERQVASELGLSDNKVNIEGSTEWAGLRPYFQAIATVNGQRETARMRFFLWVPDVP